MKRNNKKKKFIYIILFLSLTVHSLFIRINGASWAAHVKALAHYTYTKDPIKGTCTNAYCHSNGNGIFRDIPRTPRTPPDKKCSLCHWSPQTDEIPERNEHKWIVSIKECERCHPATFGVDENGNTRTTVIHINGHIDTDSNTDDCYTCHRQQVGGKDQLHGGALNSDCQVCHQENLPGKNPSPSLHGDGKVDIQIKGIRFDDSTSHDICVACHLSVSGIPVPASYTSNPFSTNNEQQDVPHIDITMRETSYDSSFSYAHNHTPKIMNSNTNPHLYRLAAGNNGGEGGVSSMPVGGGGQGIPGGASSSIAVMSPGNIAPVGLNMGQPLMTVSTPTIATYPPMVGGGGQVIMNHGGMGVDGTLSPGPAMNILPATASLGVMGSRGEPNIFHTPQNMSGTNSLFAGFDLLPRRDNPMAVAYSSPMSWYSAPGPVPAPMAGMFPHSLPPQSMPQIYDHVSIPYMNSMKIPPQAIQSTTMHLPSNWYSMNTNQKSYEGDPMIQNFQIIQNNNMGKGYLDNQNWQGSHVPGDMGYSIMNLPPPGKNGIGMPDDGMDSGYSMFTLPPPHQHSDKDDINTHSSETTGYAPNEESHHMTPNDQENVHNQHPDLVTDCRRCHTQDPTQQQIDSAHHFNNFNGHYSHNRLNNVIAYNCRACHTPHGGTLKGSLISDAASWNGTFCNAVSCHPLHRHQSDYYPVQEKSSCNVSSCHSQNYLDIF